MRKTRVYSLWFMVYRRRIKLFYSLFFISCFLFSINYKLSTINCYADTIYLKDGTTEKGLVVEEYYDRFVLSTPDGEKEILKPKIDDIFFDEPYQNNIYLGKKFEDEGDFEKALQFYKSALISNPLFKEAQDAVKGMEDSKWRFKKTWDYRYLKAVLKSQLGIGLKKAGKKIIIDALTPDVARESGLMKGDAIIRCWAKPLTYAGLKNASRILVGLSNTILELTIERVIKVEGGGGFKFFSPLVINMEFEGPKVKFVKKESLFYKTGLREGDLIVKINNESTRYMKLADVRKKIWGPSPLHLTIRRGVMLMRKRSENNISNAMWVWHSKEVLLNEVNKKGLLEFCKAKNIKVLFFQLQYQFIPMGQFSSRPASEAGELSPGTACKLLYETRLRAFLNDAHSQGVVVYALDGSPEFCLENGHPLVLAQIKAILDFNKKGLTQERFDGLHYDNEPYILPAYHSSLKGEIINQFVALNRKCRKLIDENGVKLEFGIDIPFWFDELDSLHKKLIDICDDVGIMDYRNFASSPDGIIAHALDELRYAAQVQKKVFVGVETSRYPKQEVYFASILSKDEFNRKVTAAASPLLKTRLEGFSLRAHPYGGNVYIGLVKPEGANEENFKNALYKLESLFGRIPKIDGTEELDKFIFDVMKAISENPEFRDIQSKEYTSEGSPAKDEAGKTFLIFVVDEIMLEKLTFAGLTEQDLNNTLREAKKGFENYPSFAGFAIHHYKSYKKLCEKK